MNYVIATILGFAIYPISIGIGAVIYIEFSTLHSSPFGLIGAFIVLIAAIIWSAVEVHRKKFYQYKVPFTSDWQLAIILLTFFGYFLFPIFFYSWLQIVTNKASNRKLDFSKPNGKLV